MSDADVSAFTSLLVKLPAFSNVTLGNELLELLAKSRSCNGGGSKGGFCLEKLDVNKKAR